MSLQQTKPGGAAMVAMEAVIHMTRIRGAELTSSCDEKKAAVGMALDLASANYPGELIEICSESQAQR